MNNPLFRPDEKARVGRYAHDRRFVGQQCTVIRALDPIGGEHRYIVDVSGTTTILLEVTLQKVFERGDWRGCVWQPKREAR